MAEKSKEFREELKYVREGRKLDENLSPIPTRMEIENERIKNARIGREQAQIRDNISKQPTAGHRQLDKDEDRER